MGLSTTYTKTETDFLIQQLEKKTASGYKGDLIKTDAAPTQIGFYGLIETGIYTNLGGIDAPIGKLNFASFDGTTWSLIAVDLPQPIIEKYKDPLTDLHINGSIKVKKNVGSVDIIVNGDAFVFDAFGGYRILKAGTYNFPYDGNKIIYLSGSKDTYQNPNFDVKGEGESLYLTSESFDTKNWMPKENQFSIASITVKEGFVSKFPIFEVTPEKTDRYVDFENKGILPTRDFSRSKFYEKLLPFITKYQARNADVTLVQTGDSISTNLGWTSLRVDAMYRPPLMTEHNFNSFLEEKLRWREQKYRRFDVPNVFTEVLGGGTSMQMRDDGGVGGAWGITGNAYSLPLTKVIDGGTYSGVSYKFPAKMRRCNFILHTDYKWANTTKITVAEGNGKVEVKNDAGVWVEANNYEFSAKESATLINGTFRKSQEQKRIHMRSLTDLTEKNITIQNIGAGRFGYWGIEYSPNEFMFTYICASIGSQALYGMSFYESWRVDAFKPDLVLQQCCIINEGAISGETAAPVITPEEFTQHFEDDYNRLIGKGYLVMPYIVWGGAVMGMVNPTTGEWGYSKYNGKNLTVDDYIGQLMNMYNVKNAPAVNFFYRFTELAETKAKLEGTNNIYISAINGSGGDGNTFTLDTVHLNDYGNEILNRLLLPYFNF